MMNNNEEHIVITQEAFCKMVEETIWQLDCTYMDAVIRVADQRGVELERVNRLLNRSIREKIEREAQDLNFLEKPNRLPV